MSKRDQSVDYVKCDVCGGFHPKTETETVVIRLVKGKDCDMNKANIFRQERSSLIPNGFVPEDPKENRQPVPVVISPPKKSVIPPGIMALMSPPGTPGAAVEHRQV